MLLNNARVIHCLRSTVFFFIFLFSLLLKKEQNKIFTVFSGKKRTSKIDERNERIDIFHRTVAAVAGMMCTIFDIRFISSSSLFHVKYFHEWPFEWIHKLFFEFTSTPAFLETQKFYDVVYEKLFSRPINYAYGSLGSNG